MKQFDRILEIAFSTMNYFLFVPFVNIRREILKPNQFHMFASAALVLISIAVMSSEVMPIYYSNLSMNIDSFGPFLQTVSRIAVLLLILFAHFYKYSCFKLLADKLSALEELHYGTILCQCKIIFTYVACGLICIIYTTLRIWHEAGGVLTEFPFYIAAIVSVFYEYFFFEMFLLNVRYVTCSFGILNQHMSKALHKYCLSGDLRFEVNRSFVRNWRDSQSDLCDISVVIEEAFAFQVLMQVAESFVVITYNLYYNLRYSVLSEMNYNSYCSVTIYTIFYFSQLFQVSKFCSSSVQEVICFYFPF